MSVKRERKTNKEPNYDDNPQQSQLIIFCPLQTQAPRSVSVFFMLCVFDASEKQIAAMRADFASDVERRRKILPQSEWNPDSTHTVRESAPNKKTAFWIAALRMLVKHSR